MIKKLLLDDLPFNKEDTVVLALSGGRDSMVLLDLLIKDKYNVIIAHVNHHKRAQSEQEEKYISEYAKKNNLPCEINHYYYDGKDNFQSLAREFRYNFFYQVAKQYKANYILTAHHADDLAETILLRLISGSNLYGYGGISLQTPFKDIYIYRPLLYISRGEINDYVIKNKVLYFEDESNEENDYLRNRIRHNILPLFKKENPNFLQEIINYSTILKESFAYIRSNTIAYLNSKLSIDIPSFKKLNIALQKDILNYLLEQHKLNISSNLINDLLKLINNKRPQLDYSLNNNYFFLKRYDKAYISLKQPITNKSITLKLGDSKEFLNYKFTLTKNISDINAKAIKIWYNDIDLPLIIRTRLPGDYLEFNYGKKKIKDYFIDLKLTKEKRDACPIITTIENKIIAIYDLINLSKGNKYCYLICEVKHD